MKSENAFCGDASTGDTVAFADELPDGIQLAEVMATIR